MRNENLIFPTPHMPFQVLGVGRDISDGLYKLFNSKQDIVNKKRQSELTKRTEWLI